jgi:ketosteroid isomerase-like protein
MSQENVELARATLAAFIEVDEALVEPQRLEEFFAQDGVTTFSGFMQDQVTLHGIPEFLEFRATWMEPYDDWSYEAQEIFDAGTNQVVVTLIQRGKPHGSDSWVEMNYGLVYTVEENLITRADFYATPEEALKAAGLRE